MKLVALLVLSTLSKCSFGAVFAQRLLGQERWIPPGSVSAQAIATQRQWFRPVPHLDDKEPLSIDPIAHISISSAVKPFISHGMPGRVREPSVSAEAGGLAALPGTGAVSLDSVAQQLCPVGIQMDANEVEQMEVWMAEGAAAHNRTKFTSLHLEWGTGGSTIHSAHRAGHVAGIEHHPEWCAMVTRCLQHMAWEHVTLACAPHDSTQADFNVNAPTFRLNEGSFRAFANYVNTPFMLPWPQGSDFTALDSILVDGRARIACALRAYAFMDMGTVLMLHDSNREYYTTRLAPYFDFVKERDCTLPARGICRLRPLPHVVGRVLPESFIAAVADLRQFSVGEPPLPLPPPQEMPFLVDFIG